jgi:hypothetical protein
VREVQQEPLHKTVQKHETKQLTQNIKKKKIPEEFFKALYILQNISEKF